VSSFRRRRLASLVSLALLGAMLLGTGATSASAPQWTQSPVTSLPPTVGPGTNAGYSFSATNNGPSNISALYLVSTLADPAVYAHWQVLSSGGTLVREGSCPTDAALKCTIGAVNATQTVSFLIAYAVGTSNFSVIFQANTTGSIINPNGHNHGDALQWTGSTSVSNSQNFAGGFQLTGAPIGTTGNLGKKNDQTSTVTPKAGSTLVPVTIEDALTSQPGGTTSLCSDVTCIGDWTEVHSGGGTNVDGPIMVTLLLYGPSIPNGATVDNINLWHQGSTPNEIISLRCSDPSAIPHQPGNTGAECVTVTKLGNNFQIVAWLHHNGGIRSNF
jgi:hypothetical protein